jgi:hypothetical protein
LVKVEVIKTVFVEETPPETLNEVIVLGTSTVPTDVSTTIESVLVVIVFVNVLAIVTDPILVTPLTTSVVATTKLVIPVEVVVMNTLVVALESTVVGLKRVTVLNRVTVLPPETIVVKTLVGDTPILVLVTCSMVVNVVGKRKVFVSVEVISDCVTVPSVRVIKLVSGILVVTVVVTFVKYVLVNVEVIKTVLVEETPPETLKDVMVLGTSTVPTEVSTKMEFVLVVIVFV